MFSQKSKKLSKEITEKRLNDFFILIILCFVIVIINLWYLQIIRGKEFEQKAINNCIRSLVEEAPRGEVYDRNGKLLVTNRPAVNFSVIPAEISDYQTMSDNLSLIIFMDSSSILDKIRSSKQNPFHALTIKRDLEKDKIITIEEQKYKFKGSLLTVQPERKYLYQNLASHVLGYVNEISEEELNAPTFSHLSGGDIVGKSGLERYYDSYLRGEKGKKDVEVDALGREITTIEIKNPVAGNDIYLTLDCELQQYIEQQMFEKKGSVIVSEPFTGKILAMVSYPDYNPNIFTQQMTTAQWQEIAQNKDNVLCNRNLHSIYPPGSVFKVITAIAAIEEGIVNLGSSIYCPGYYQVGDLSFKCWKESGHGKQAIIEAIANSCNVFFYTIGQKLGIDKLNYYTKLLGLGEKTGIDLPGELEGLVPSEDWKRDFYNQSWYPGDTVNMSIGQGFLLVTPLQIHNMLSLIANEGLFFRFYHVEKIISQSGEIIKEFEPQLINKIDISQNTFQIIKEGMKKVVENGTGRLANIEEIKIAGKTGTAQNPQGENHAWFIGFAPYDNPEICVTVLIEHGGDGSTVAAPLAGNIIRKYFQLKYNQIAKAEQF
ncbi:MAG: penicillin-binding protein 2 [Atribacterota bacterium]|nr:penicillin-binding protein 2 [Atribacterota bacterium]MDD5636485.1 penicillin-binding protein 2 [Atribacterota bacterium]